MGATTDIASCASCHGFNGGNSTSLKAVYTSDRIFIRASWPDSTASLTRGGAWSWESASWQTLDGDQSEDRIALYFPMTATTGELANAGCMAKCHVTDPGSWLLTGTADMWHTKAGRSGPVLSMSGSGLTIDATTNEVTAGTLTMVGFADDKHVAQDGGADRGRYGDAGSSTYARNRIGDATRPKYIETAPADYADAMVLTQVEIDDGEVAGDATTGVSDADAATYWPAYAALNAIIPERILRVPTGSRGDIDFAATWSDGIWTVEMGRALDTGNGDDLQFVAGQEYHLNIATMDNGGGGAEHETSAGIVLRLAPEPPPGPVDMAGMLGVLPVGPGDEPTVDGLTDDIWDYAPNLDVPMGATTDITLCSSCHGFDSGNSTSLKAMYTSDRLYMRASWADPTASLTRGGAWSWESASWQTLDGDQSEDRIAFYFPITETTGELTNMGCMAKCHVSDPGSWLLSGTADMWHTKAGRSGPVLSMSGSGLTVDATTNEVTAGSLTMVGFADDKYVAQDGGGDRGRYGDAGSSTYGRNRIGDATRPKYIETAPTDYADAMVLTQSEIDSGEVAGDGTTGVSDADAATYWPAYAALNAIVPERILRAPTGSRGDIEFAANWSDGIWTVELGRDLDTGNDDDVQFDTEHDYHFNVATMDNGGGGVEHETSQGIAMTFLGEPSRIVVRDVPNDQGGKVSVRWDASPLDNDVNVLPYYSVWRAMPPGMPRVANGRYRLAEYGGVPYDWEWLADQPALRLNSYAFTAGTLYDSTSATDGMHHFMVVAHASDPDEFFKSVAAGGYSVDNISPAAPNLRPAAFVAGKVTLSWQPLAETDLRRYLIYRSDSPNIDVADLAPIATTMDTVFVDGDPLTGTSNYYVVRGQDIHDNLGALSVETSASVPSGISASMVPDKFALLQNTPNPFNPSTRIPYHLAADVNVLLEVYDLLGRRVVVLANTNLNAGVYEAVWNGTDARGVAVASGVYVVRFVAGEFVGVQRMTIVR